MLTRLSFKNSFVELDTTEFHQRSNSLANTDYRSLILCRRDEHGTFRWELQFVRLGDSNAPIWERAFDGRLDYWSVDDMFSLMRRLYPAQTIRWARWNELTIDQKASVNRQRRKRLARQQSQALQRREAWEQYRDDQDIEYRNTSNAVPSWY